MAFRRASLSMSDWASWRPALGPSALSLAAWWRPPARIGEAGQGTAWLARSRRSRRGAAILRGSLLTAMAAVVVGGGLAAASVLVAARAPRPVDAEDPARGWTEIVRPLQIYSLSGSAFTKLPSHYRARRHRPDGGREDVLEFGATGQDGPMLLVALLRRGGVDAPLDAETLADGTARLAALTGDMASLRRPLPGLATRFGGLERAEASLWRGETRRSCEAFRLRPGDGSVLRIAGFACAETRDPLPDQTLACAIDRLDLLSSGEDQALRALFVAAERDTTTACRAGERAVLSLSHGPSPPPRHLTWLDTAAEPPLRAGIGEP